MCYSQNEPIAIVGTGCRFPGNADTSSKLWDLLSSPRDLSSNIPISRFNSDGFYHRDGAHHGTSNVRKSYFLEEDVRRFDSQFFNISTAEAESMDPQQRQLLEVVFEAMESANLTMEQMRGSPTAVYVGLMCDDYSGLIFSDMESVPTYGATGAARSILSNRISYFYDWNGPSYTIDSACSSSLVAVHQAVQQLRNGECSIALAAGANLILSPRMFIAESKLNMLSPNGRCRMWDHNGDGYARGEGIAAVLLKRLSDAIADGDHIDCIIRETHVNQGGRSTGLTVPNPVAQVNLIRETYKKAGLDLDKPGERPQYFQAHGTGTKVGDLNEATAIHNTFFADGKGGEDEVRHADLYVGSVKTVVGHSEGAAGIAGLLEACLAVRHGVIPPNLHFETLNPKLGPFYAQLDVPTTARAWPNTFGGVRRASVNSFGFGGTNAHVILESHEAAPLDPIAAAAAAATVTAILPFTFSAATDRSLGSLLFNYSQFLDANPDTDLNALAWTLINRRSVLTHKVAFTAHTARELCSKLNAEIERRKNGESRALVSRPMTRPKSILGVFTGQGAQWAKMGWDLIFSSPTARQTLDALEQSLQNLPVDLRPTWSLQSELSASASDSHISEAAFSQPLCTAVQIILVDCLKEAGVRFAAVVGHSSGEIGAAYAAGFINAEDAIKIAYCRGYFAHLAGNDNGTKGAMLAVGTSMTEAAELCQSEQFRGRISVAASNSSTSVTLSGDSDAIDEAKTLYEERGVFVRILKVDTAYHSSHMVPCSNPYLQALGDCDIQVLQRPGEDEECVWFSSVNHGKLIPGGDVLKGTYWMENMLQPVLFSQAVSQAAEVLGTFDFVLEVGPHPALKGPASQTLQEIGGSNKAIPYSGLLARGLNSIETFAEAMGKMWTHFGSSSFLATSYFNLFHAGVPKPLTGLPTYPWDHERILWYESRGSRETRLRSDPPHQLLGIVSSDQAEGEFSWRNYLRLNEIPWLVGHKIQGQTIFPAAGYVVMALEASKFVARDQTVNLVEIMDLKILQAISINDDTSGAETLFGVKNVKHDEKMDIISADFTCHACLGKDTGSLVLASTGQLLLHLGVPSLCSLPSRSQTPITDLRDVDVDAFYESLQEVGYGYTGPFRAISSLQQKLDISTGFILDANFGDETENDKLMLHPASLDAAIQSLFACLGSPGDGSLWSMHVPVGISSIRVNPSMCAEKRYMRFDAAIVDGVKGVLCGDVTLYHPEDQNAIIQMEGIEVKPLMPATPADDRDLFHELAWGVAEPDAALVYRTTGFSEEELRKAEILERICLFYLRQLLDTVTANEREFSSWHGKRILDFASGVLDSTKEQRHKSCQIEWLDDSFDMIQLKAARYASDVDIRLLHVVGQNLVPFVRSETTILEHMLHDGLLNSYYQNSELLEYNEYAGKLAAQIAFRYPLAKVLEIGAGTGGVTRSILRHLDNKYSSYTFTDISIAFFDQAQDTFGANSRIIYEALDIEREPSEQGFDVGSYDLVIASNVLHATKDLDNTMANVRKLLKPGGKLLVLEAIDNGAVRVGFSFCGVPGWWAAEDDRKEALGPLITTGQWSNLLLRNGFSGLDTITPGTEDVHQPVAVFVSSAVDEQLKLLRDPLSYVGKKDDIGTVFIVGGKSGITAALVDDLKILLARWSANVYVVESLDQEANTFVASGLVHVLNLSELDAPVFRDLTPSRLEAFKSLLNISKSFLWVTSGAKSQSPYSSMALGIGRTLVHEMPHLRLQVLDAAKANGLNASLLVEAFLRIIFVESWENDIYAKQSLWSNEPELWLQEGKLSVTRVVPEKRANERLMSCRRVIGEGIDTDGDIVDLIADGPSYQLKKRLPLPQGPTEVNTDNLSIKVTHSTLLALKSGPTSYLHLVLGEIASDGTKVIALSASIGSTISTPACWTLPWEVIEGQEASILSRISWDIIAKTILDSASKSSTLMLLEPGFALADAITKRARFTSMKVAFLTSGIAPDNRRGWLSIHPFSSDRELKARLPKDARVFVDCSAFGSSESQDLSHRIQGLLPRFCKKLDASDLYCCSSFLDPEVSINVVGDVLRVAAANSMSAILSSKNSTLLETVGANELSTIQVGDLRPRIVDWTTDSKLRVRVQSAEDMMCFRGDRTYLLIGLSGNLGRSLCKWMIIRGARHFVLASRNPAIEQSWLDEMGELGGEITVMAMDVSNKAQVESAISIIHATLPPLAGVANAAMVLSDTLLSNMSFTEMQTVLKPKVDGSRYLSELFPTNNLDFFILFGSSVDVMGNSGQAAYCAANMFMNSLVCSRQARGLAGSLIGLGEVKGVGYAARLGRKLNDIIGATLPLSEREVHQMFAEGVLAGKPDSGRNPILYAGMDSKDPKKDPDILWYPHPKFWHYIESSDGAAAIDSKSSPTESLKSQLSTAKTSDGVKSIILVAFIFKLHHKLQVSSDNPISPEAVLLELGIDSLVAVDLRAWFVTELGVDMPILKILGGSTIVDLVADGVARLPASIVPLLEVGKEEGMLVPNGLGGLDLVKPPTKLTVPVEKVEETKPEVPITTSEPDSQEISTPLAEEQSRDMEPRHTSTETQPASFEASSETESSALVSVSPPSPELREVSTTSDSDGEAVIVRLRHMKHASISSFASSEPLEVFTPTFSTFSTVSSMHGDEDPETALEDQSKCS